MTEYIAELEKGEELGNDMVGAKALNLSILKNNDFNVPYAHFVTTPAHDHYKEKGDLPSIDFYQLNLPEKVSVRSSATVEDSKKASFAGMFDTFLNVTNEKIKDSIIGCYESAEGRGVKIYMRDMNISGPVKMGVILQEMIDPDTAGIIFTKSPIGLCKDSLQIDVVEGLCDKLTLGSATPDTYCFNRENGSPLSKRLKDKEYGPILRYKQVQDLFKVSMEIEKLFDYPQDIEFAISGDDIFILQSRPITRLDEW